MCPTLAVTITVEPNAGTPPLTVYFASFPSGGLAPYVFLWNFGDGSPDAVTQNAVHTYVAGIFQATCAVTDTLGRTVTSLPASLTVSPVVPPVSFTIQQDQVCVATAPGSLNQIRAPPNLETLLVGPALEAIPGTYYDRCLGEFIGANGVPVTTFASSVSCLDGSLTISPTSGDVIASLNTGNPNTWTALQTFGTNISLLGYPFAGGSPAVGQVIQFNGANWIAATLSAAGTTWPTITDPAGAFVDTSTPGIGGVGFVGGGAYNPAPGQGLFTIGTANAGLTGNYLSIQNSAGTEIAHIDHSGNYVVGSTTSYRDGSIVVGTGTLTLPPNVTDTVVLLAANQTLTTKTLTTPTINGAAMSGTVTGTPTWGSAQTFPSLNSTAHGAGSATAIGLLLGSGTASAQAGVFTGSNHLLLIGFGYYLPGNVLGIGIGNGSGYGVGTANSLFDDASGNMTVGGTLTMGGATFTYTNTTSANYVQSNLTTIALFWIDSGAGNAQAMALFTGAEAVSASYTLSIGAVHQTSDIRLKTDFTDYPSDPLAELSAVRVGIYRTMGGRDLGSWRAGVAAQTLPPTVHELARGGYFGVRHPDYEAWLTIVMKAQQAEIQILKDELAALSAGQNH